MKRLAILAAVLLMLATARAAYAHRPIFVQVKSNTTRATAIKIEDVQVSWAIYAQLSQPGEINYYAFDGKRGESVYINLNLPKTQEATQFGLDVALIGKGLTPDASVPVGLNAGEGALIAQDTGHDPANVFFEPFTQTSYWVRQTMRVTLPSDGAYTVAVYNSENKIGKYVLAVGEREEWDASDVPAMPSVWVGVQKYFGNPDLTNLGIGLLVGAVVITAGVVFFFLRK